MIPGACIRDALNKVTLALLIQLRPKVFMILFGRKSNVQIGFTISNNNIIYIFLVLGFLKNPFYVLCATGKSAPVLRGCSDSFARFLGYVR